jgi:hypothetical protein
MITYVCNSMYMYILCTYMCIYYVHTCVYTHIYICICIYIIFNVYYIYVTRHIFVICLYIFSFMPHKGFCTQMWFHNSRKFHRLTSSFATNVVWILIGPSPRFSKATKHHFLMDISIISSYLLNFCS